ncbi:MAG: carbon-nitrogen hydrolase family protein [Acidimicrobiia bacterium]|nr:carbon-nitrogen hydrolase family protein [Acidimicrobiia bacterium]
MRVTVCELSNERGHFGDQWTELVAHCRREKTELLLLPEMPFSPWLAKRHESDQKAWLSAVVEHESWRSTLVDLAPTTVVGTQPIVDEGARFNEGFVWSAVGGYRPGHRKSYLPNEEGFWEANWYQAGPKEFTAVDVEETTLGFLICTEMWFTEHARSYARAGVSILAAPRATGASSTEKWIAGGRAAAVMAGAFCLSSNRGGLDAAGFDWGGHGWIIEPEEGDVLGTTSSAKPFLTIDIDLDVAVRAKQTYPRYISE